MAQVVVARQHTNGNITSCIYLVDLLRLGVKDTFYAFNISPFEYREKIAKFKDGDQYDPIGYELAHNIIFAGIEFAEDYGCKPHKDFISITCFMLEEDNDSIPLIDIECGHYGLPAFMPSPEDNNVKIKQIIAQLEREAGSDNYYLFDEEGNLIGDDGEEEKDDEDDEFSDMTFKEKGDEFKQYYSRLGKLDEEKNHYFFNLLQSIIDDMTNIDEYNRYYDELLEEFSEIEVGDEEIPDELLGLIPDASLASNGVKEQFIKVLNSCNDPKIMKKQLDLFRKNAGVEAAAEYLDLLNNIHDHSKKYEVKLKSAAFMYASYPLIQIIWTKYNIKQDIIDQLPGYPFKMDYFFKGRNKIHAWEYFNYLDMYTHFVMAEKNFDKLEALKSVIFDLNIEEGDIITLHCLISIIQTEIVAGYFYLN